MAALVWFVTWFFLSSRVAACSLLSVAMKKEAAPLQKITQQKRHNLFLVLELCATDQFFPIPSCGVHRELRQQASENLPLVTLYRRAVVRFLGSALTRLLASSPTLAPSIFSLMMTFFPDNPTSTTYFTTWETTLAT
jgi:hypothetical protein